MTIRIRQEIIFAETRITGTYRYGSLFKLRPIFPEAPTLLWSMGHHPALLEFFYYLPDVSETNYNPQIPEQVLLPMIDNEASAKVRKWLLLVLSVFAKNRLFQYKSGPLEQQWFMKLPTSEKDIAPPTGPYWGQAAYSHSGVSAWIVDTFSATSEPSIRLVEANEYYQSETPRQYVVGKTSDVFELPDRITEFMDQYMALSEPSKNSFLSSCFLFDQGFQLFYAAPSLAFAACVSSLETLIAFDHKGEPREKCECCDQPKYQVRQKFLAFIKKYGSDSPEARKMADRVYQRRSGILHEGQLFVGEIDQKTTEGSIEWINDDRSRRETIRFFRTCIINWLILNSRSRSGAL